MCVRLRIEHFYVQHDTSISSSLNVKLLVRYFHLAGAIENRAFKQRSFEGPLSTLIAINGVWCTGLKSIGGHLLAFATGRKSSAWRRTSMIIYVTRCQWLEYPRMNDLQWKPHRTQPFPRLHTFDPLPIITNYFHKTPALCRVDSESARNFFGTCTWGALQVNLPAITCDISLLNVLCQAPHSVILWSPDFVYGTMHTSYGPYAPMMIPVALLGSTTWIFPVAHGSWSFFAGQDLVTVNAFGSFHSCTVIHPCKSLACLYIAATTLAFSTVIWNSAEVRGWSITHSTCVCCLGFTYSFLPFSLKQGLDLHLYLPTFRLTSKHQSHFTVMNFFGLSNDIIILDGDTNLKAHRGQDVHLILKPPLAIVLPEGCVCTSRAIALDFALGSALASFTHACGGSRGFSISMLHSLSTAKAANLGKFPGLLVQRHGADHALEPANRSHPGSLLLTIVTCHTHPLVHDGLALIGSLQRLFVRQCLFRLRAT